jgi:hypothetical protein
LFRLACEHDLEGVIAKWKRAPYVQQKPPSWLKIRNRNYSQWVGREELFERERERDPDFAGWDSCARGVRDGCGISPRMNSPRPERCCYDVRKLGYRARL